MNYRTGTDGLAVYSGGRRFIFAYYAAEQHWCMKGRHGRYLDILIWIWIRIISRQGPRTEASHRRIGCYFCSVSSLKFL